MPELAFHAAAATVGTVSVALSTARKRLAIPLLLLLPRLTLAPGTTSEGFTYQPSIF